MNQKPIFILGAHKSGTSLLRSILNGHSQLYTIPIEAHFFQNMNYWVDNEYRSQRPESINREKLIDNFYEYIRQSNRSINPLSDSISKGLFDLERFRPAFSSNFSEINHKDCLEKYLEAIFYSVTGKILDNKTRIVEKSVENGEFVSELAQFFPKAKFIHIIRNPYANIVSLRKFKSHTHGAPIFYRMAKTLYNSYYCLYKNEKIIHNYYIIRYEDLVSAPEKEIENLCKFLEIPFEEILLTPTYQGKIWHGNSSRGLIFNNISSINLEKWESEIHPLEVEYINRLFYFVIKDYGYNPVKRRGSIWRYLKGEDIKRYVANRLYLFYLKDYN